MGFSGAFVSLHLYSDMSRNVKLIFLNLMDELDSTNGESHMIKAHAPQQRSYALCHATVALFDYIVERAARPRTECCW